MVIKAKAFEKISIRGCVAYGICCFENALEHYGLQGEGWNFLLKKLWWYTELRAYCDSSIRNCYPLERWAGLLSQIMPGDLNSVVTYRDFLSEKWWFDDDIPSEKEFALLKETYKSSNHVIELLCTHLHQIGSNCLWCGVGKTSPDTLRPLQELIDVMYENEIPLPSMEPFKQYVFHKKGWYSMDLEDDLHAYGETFDGTQYSKFVRK